MPEAQSDFASLMKRVLGGCPQAARELTERYGSALLRAVRYHLSDQLRSKFDSRDFVQDVWASFFAGLPAGGEFREPTQLVAFLARLAANKVIDATRQRLQSQKFNVNREQYLEETPGAASALIARQPTPSEVAMGREEWERLLESQPPVYRCILGLLHDGKSPAAAAAELRVSERTVRRVAGRVAPWLIK
jgi:RNA polymerase sigma-70 factor (ECF subfamily)